MAEGPSEPRRGDSDARAARPTAHGPARGGSRRPGVRAPSPRFPDSDRPGSGTQARSEPRLRPEPLILPEPPAAPAEVLLDLLATGELELVGRLAGSSNNALLGIVRGPEPAGRGSASGVSTPTGARLEAPVVYKPIAGERPLWDFPDGTLAHRELAAYLLSAAAGWGIVPPTVFRTGPFGPGMVQLWVPADPSADRVALVVGADPRLRPIALFDVVANNADRKVGHLIPTREGTVLGVDHGICFHVEPKLRTVLWAWRGERLTTEERDRLARLVDLLRGDLAVELGEHLAPAEVAALRRRAEELLERPCFPEPDPDRPAIPWPPY